MKVKSSILINELKTFTTKHLQEIESFMQLSEEELTKRTYANSWNALECIEHLNLYGRYYLPEIKRKMLTSNLPAANEFKSGWLGNYFANSMLPKEKLNKMKTLKKTNPIHQNLTKNVLEEFHQQLIEILNLLTIAQDKNLNKIKTGISISSLVKLKLGDTLRVLIYHNERHVLQAKKALLI